MSISGQGTFGALTAIGSVMLTRRRYSGPPTIGVPSANAPIVDPQTGMMTQTELAFRTQISADLAAIKKQLGIP